MGDDFPARDIQETEKGKKMLEGVRETGNRRLIRRKSRGRIAAQTPVVSVVAYAVAPTSKHPGCHSRPHRLR